MDNTPLLSLPLLAYKQDLQTTFHDEAIKTLDALVMLSVIDRDLSSPPASPSEGDRYIVKAPGSGDDAWDDNNVVAFIDDHWRAHPPRLGWTCYVQDEAALVAWNGTAWQPAINVLGGAAVQNLALLGVGTTADATNPLSAKLNNALWTAKPTGEGGSGDLRYKLSKQSAAHTLSLLLQDNSSGRAEIGLTGDDDLHFKVSADGTTWIDAMVLDRATGGVRLLAHETSVASTATCDIGAAMSLKVSITGTTTITSLGTRPHQLKLVHFADALILTHHATSLVLPGGANVVTAAGDTAIFASNGSGHWRCLSYTRATAPPAPPAIVQRQGTLTPTEKLVVVYASASTVDVDADAVVLFDAAGNARRYTGVNLTASIAASGANGLDTGAEGASRWYAVWCIGKADGTIASLLSESHTSPVLPADYTFKGLVGAVRNDAGSNFVPMRQFNRRATLSLTTLVVGGSQVNFASVLIGAAAPPWADLLIANIDVFTTAGTAYCRTFIAPAASGTTSTYGEGVVLGGTVDINGYSFYAEFPVDTASGQFFYRTTGTNNQTNIQIRGWQF